MLRSWTSLRERASARTCGNSQEDARNWCETREVVVFGKAWREVLRRSADDEADLIVMGVHGRGPVEVGLFGSTTHHVMREATRPVLTMRRR